MNLLPTSLAARAWGALKLARSAVRLSRAEDEQVAAQARAYLAQSMGELRGLPQKIGQILSMSDSPAARDFDALTGEAEPLPFATIAAVLAEEWGRPWSQVLSGIETQGHAASLGQVHRGTLADGRSVAVKVQYPGIGRSVESDLKLLGWITLPVGGLGRGFNLRAYRDEILRDFNEELDYLREARHQRRFQEQARAWPNVIVPEVIPELTTPRVLVSAWEDGETLAAVAAHWSAADRKAAGRLLLHCVLNALFREGFVQGDLHAGNFRFRRGARGLELVLYDFGCMFAPAREARLAFLRLIDMAEANRDGDPYPLFLKLGFDPAYLEPLAHKLPALSRVLFEPFLLEGEYGLAGWKLGERVSDILGDDRWNFRVAGPAELILLMRVFHGLLHALGRLDAHVPWKALLRPIRDDLRAEAQALALPAAAQTSRSFARLAKYLLIQVNEQGAMKVRLTSPLHVVDDLENAMDPETLAKVRNRGIDLAAIVSRVRASGYAPQEVFTLDEGPKQIRVWLQ
jgi:predicted unusual protein kinase regulating ubiquinone biosynthesis (AarF/ABC1/UbiB family)